MTKEKFYAFMVKLDRAAAWILFFTMIAYALTGYGLAKGFADYETASRMHLAGLGVLALPAFIIHTAWGIHCALRRWGIWNVFSKIILALFYFGLAAFFLYLHFYYEAPSANQRAAENNPVAQKYTKDDEDEREDEDEDNRVGAAAGKSGNEPAAKQESPAFNKAELARYDGRDGRPAYAAIDGKVYDLSEVFKRGQHKGYASGQDLSEAFHSKHAQSILSKFKIVGEYRP